MKAMVKNLVLAALLVAGSLLGLWMFAALASRLDGGDPPLVIEVIAGFYGFVAGFVISFIVLGTLLAIWDERPRGRTRR